MTTLHKAAMQLADKYAAAMERGPFSRSYQGNVQQARNELFDFLRSALAQQGEQPVSGWKLVPVEPTDGMLYEIQENCHILPPRGKRIWAQMLAAAPEAPQKEQT